MLNRHWFCLLFILLFLFLWGAPALAGSGMEAKDGCHWDRKADPPERHWHKRVDGKKVRGGPCLKFFNRTFKFGANAICAKERAGYTMAKNDVHKTTRSELFAARQVIGCLKNYRPPSRRRQ